jgi:hypothetical protein
MTNPIELTQKDYLILLDVVEDIVDELERDGDMTGLFYLGLKRIAKWASFEAGVG